MKTITIRVSKDTLVEVYIVGLYAFRRELEASIYEKFMLAERRVFQAHLEHIFDKTFELFWKYERERLKDLENTFRKHNSMFYIRYVSKRHLVKFGRVYEWF